MAKAEHIKKLIASFGRTEEFRIAALRIIDDAQQQGKKPFADSLRKILDSNVRPGYQAPAQPGLTTLASQIDSAAYLLEAIEVTRGLGKSVRKVVERSRWDSKANRIETMKGPAESGEILFGGSGRKIAKKIANHRPS
jgi:hypothetical protein